VNKGVCGVLPFSSSRRRTTCLATANAVDSLYACEAHLSDTRFATGPLDPGPVSAAARIIPAVSEEEIGVEAKQEARKKEKAGAGADPPSPSPSLTSSGAGAAPTYLWYSLHRDSQAQETDEADARAGA